MASLSNDMQYWDKYGEKIIYQLMENGSYAVAAAVIDHLPKSEVQKNFTYLLVKDFAKRYISGLQ